ncbi:MAG: hypothetical protein JJU02_12440 [Cryomorphaceae bacterium]|nr:hypothetical protein [Cryomorphaceae bacterium]
MNNRSIKNSRNHQVEDRYDESYPLFELEKISEMMGEVLQDYFDRVQS